MSCPVLLNFLAVPTSSTDPITAFDVSHSRLALVTGSATGKILAWYIPHVISNLAPHLSAAAAAAAVQGRALPLRFDCARPACRWTPPRPTQLPRQQPQQQQSEQGSAVSASASASASSLHAATSAASASVSSLTAAGPPVPLTLPPKYYPVKVICERADEGVRGVHLVSAGAEVPANSPIRPGTMIAVIGDLTIKLALSLSESSCLNMKFQRPHSDRLCAETTTLHYKHVAALLVPCDPYACVVLDAFQQKQFILSQLDIPAGARPLHFDGKRLGWMHPHLAGARCFTLASVATQAPTCFTAFSPEEPVTCLLVAGARAVAVVNAATVCVRDFCPIAALDEVRARLGPPEASVAGPGDAPLYREAREELGPLAAPPGSGSSTAASAAAAVGHAGDAWAGGSERSIRAIAAEAGSAEVWRFLAHDQGVVLAVLAENDGEDIITLGSEGKLKLWHRGRLVAKFVNIAGTFTRNSPVVLRRRGHAVYYTADAGVFVVHIPFPAVGPAGELRLDFIVAAAAAAAASSAGIDVARAAAEAAAAEAAARGDDDDDGGNGGGANDDDEEEGRRAGAADADQRDGADGDGDEEDEDGSGVGARGKSSGGGTGGGGGGGEGRSKVRHCQSQSLLPTLTGAAGMGPLGATVTDRNR